MKPKYKPMWEIKQQLVPSVLDLYIYGEVQRETRVEGANGWEGKYVEAETSANHFRRELESHPDVTQINVYINSPGGSVFEGVAIYSQLRRHPAHKTAYVDGFACSVASVIAMAADEVIMPPNTMMFIHNASMAAFGNAAEMRKVADELDTISEAARQAYLDKAGDKLDEDTLSEMLAAETWLTARQCVEYGLADKLAERDADLSTASNVLQQVQVGLEQRLAIQRSLSNQIRELVQAKPGNRPTASVEVPVGPPIVGGPLAENPVVADPAAASPDAAGQLPQAVTTNHIMTLFANN